MFEGPQLGPSRIMTTAPPPQPSASGDGEKKMVNHMTKSKEIEIQK